MLVDGIFMQVLHTDMKQRLTGILLLFAFAVALLQPVVPFVQYYYAQEGTDVVYLQDDDCGCSCQAEQTTKMANNGDAYLKALIKRVCKDKEKEQEKLPVVNISIFVKTLYTPNIPVYTCPEQNYTEISDFIIQAPTSSHIEELFRPPRLS